MLTVDTITHEQIRALFVELINLPISRTNQDISDIKSIANALGYSEIVEGVNCRIPPGMEAEYRRRGRVRAANIFNTRNGR